MGGDFAEIMISDLLQFVEGYESAIQEIKLNIVLAD